MSARSRKILVETVLTVGALAGVLCVVVAIVSVAFGLSPLVVRSGSMSPTIATGDIAIARSVPANDVRIGDIVSVTRPDGTRVTHRVTTIDARVGNSTTMTLRGDANPVADAEPYTVTSVERVAFHIPKAGYVLTWFATPWVWALATLAVIGLLWLAFRPDRLWRARRHGRHAKVSRTADLRSVAVQVIAVGVVIASAVTGYARTSGAFAALTDTATATGTVSAIRPTAPTSLSCTTVSTGLLSTGARLSWPNPVANQGYSYQLVFTPRLLGTSKTVTLAKSTTDPTILTVDSSYVTTILGLSVLGTYDVELRSKVGNFTSSGRLTIALNVLLGSVSCGAASGTASAPAGAAARQAAPTSSSSTTPSTLTGSAPSSSTTATTTPTPSSTTTSSPTTTSTTTPPPAAPAGVASPDGSYVVTVSDGVVVIRTAAGAEEYRGSGTSVTWTGPATLRVTGSDGTTTDLTRGADGEWTTAAPAAATDTTTTTTTIDSVG